MAEGERPPTQDEEAVTAPQLTLAAPPAGGAPPAGRKRRLGIASAALILVIAAAALTRAYVFETDVVEGGSMLPGLWPGDYVLVYKLGREQAPRRFSVVTFRAPDAPEVLIKRVIGLPGDWVWVWGDHVFVNGGRLEEPYVTRWNGQFLAPVWVPPGSVYVLGDNRDESEDSRVWGPVALSSLRGRAELVFLPLSRAGTIR